MKAEAVLLLNDKAHFDQTLKECQQKGQLMVVDYYTTWYVCKAASRPADCIRGHILCLVMVPSERPFLHQA